MTTEFNVGDIVNVQCLVNSIIATEKSTVYYLTLPNGIEVRRLGGIQVNEETVKSSDRIFLAESKTGSVKENE